MDREQGWCSGRALPSHQCGPGSIPEPSVISGLSLLLVLVLAPRVFLRVHQFSSLPPSTLLNSNSIWKQWMKSHSVEMPLQIPIAIILIIIISIIDTCSTGKELGERRIPES